MSEKPTPKWESDGFRVVFDKTPGGVVNEHGQRSYSMRIPVLEVTEWVKDREGVAAEVAKDLNEVPAKDAEIKRLQDLVTSSEQERYRGVGALVAKDVEIARLREALEPFAKAADIKLCGEWKDHERFSQTDVGFHLFFGHLRSARAALEEKADA